MTDKQIIEELKKQLTIEKEYVKRYRKAYEKVLVELYILRELVENL